MPDPPDDPSKGYSKDDLCSPFHEPHLTPGAKPPDPSESKTDQTLRRERGQTDATYRDGQSVYDEPDMFPGRESGPIEQDWSCSRCDYNLRGLPAGHPCPECGHRELYRPPPPEASSYQTWLQRRLDETSVKAGWMVAVVAALLGGAWAVVASLMGTQMGGLAGSIPLVLMVIYGPAIEETMKIATVAYIIEVRPYVFRRLEQVQVATAGAALMFAAIENVLYLTIYVSNPSTGLILFRWTVCVALHLGCTLVASRGLIEVWTQCMTEYRRPRISRSVRMLVLAIVLHGVYNGCVAAFESLVGPIR